MLSSFLLGYGIKKRMKDECELIRCLADGFCTVKEEIRYNSDYLLHSMQKVYESGEFFKKICDEMDSGKSYDDAWKTAVLTVASEDVRNVLNDMEKKIGKTDAEGQIKLFELMIDRLNTIHDKKFNLYEKQGGIYPKFGIASGILITILLI